MPVAGCAMDSRALILLSLALLLAAVAVGLWVYISQRQRHQKMVAHLQQSLHKTTHSAADKSFDASVSALGDLVLPKEKSKGLPVPSLLLGTVSRSFFYGALALIAVVFIWVGVQAGWLAAAAMLVVLSIGFFFLLLTRVQKYRLRLTQQLPGFLDNMVRLVTLGNSIQAAFQMACMSSKEPLRAVMEKSASLARAGMELDQAVALVARQTRLDELHLLAAILRISVRYGGRVDVLLERVANFMRDREQAEQDLSAMTSETRMSAWVLSLLPLVVCGLIISFNAGYFLRMWEDASGRNIIWAAAALQVFGVLLLYRLAKLEDGG